jgi:hypothetical protein
METMFTLRAIERMIGVLMGGISVFLGYRLFLNLPERTDGQGKFILPGGISVYLSRVGPGVFFALFGAGVIIASLYFSLRIGFPTKEMTAEQTKVAKSTSYSMSYSGGGAETLREARANVLGDIFLLNKMPTVLRSDLNSKDRQDIERAIPRIKLALMQSVWGDGKDWGNYQEFKKWVEEGCSGVLPKAYDEAVKYYRRGEGR